MKLLTLTNRYYLISILLITLIGSVVAYEILIRIINKQFDDKLLAEKEQFIYELHNYDNLNEILYLNIGDRIVVAPRDEDPKIIAVLQDTVMFDDYAGKNLNFRSIKFSDQVHGQFYIITITKSLLPTEGLIEGIGEIMIILIVSMVLVLLFVNRFISRLVWEPFYKTVESLKAFRLDKKEDVAFGETNINEFVELNEALNQLINKNKTDYLSLKEFTENASHEFQTPLAIIKNKSELLLQNNLSEIDMIEVVKINEAASRLSKIKNGLSMLTKMDNDQFSDVESIKLAEFIDKKTKHFEELIDLKQIGLTKKFKAHPIVQWNNTLAYMLVTNLINNAIKHNIKGGTLNIILDSKKLTIENTGKPLTDAPIQYFDRFKKGSTSADSSGLGLALIKKICDIYNMEIHYTNVGMLHVFTIDF